MTFDVSSVEGVLLARLAASSPPMPKVMARQRSG